MKVYSLLVLLCLVVLCAHPLRAEDKSSAFVILNASILDEKREIKNICLFRKRRCAYLDPSASYAKIEAGRYRLQNVDFTDNEKNGRGNIWFDEVVNFRFKENRVYFLGHLKLSERKGGKYKMDFDQDLEVLVSACKALPAAAKEYPLANAINGKQIGINCERILRSDT